MAANLNLDLSGINDQLAGRMAAGWTMLDGTDRQIARAQKGER